MKALIITVITSLTLSVSAKEEFKLIEDSDQCLTAREYITAYRYLTEKKEFGIKKDQAQKIADKVSLGCTGSSQRFINVLNALIKLGISANTAVPYALNFTKKSDNYTEAFIDIFKKSYDPKYLNLDIQSSLKNALRLSKDYSGNLENALNDFENLVEFCLDDETMKMPIAECGALATKVAGFGEKFEDPIAKPFIELLKFLQEEDKGPKVNKSDALKIAVKVIPYGSKAVENYIRLYKFSTSKKGLGYTASQALPLSLKLAQRSLPPAKRVK